VHRDAGQTGSASGRRGKRTETWRAVENDRKERRSGDGGVEAEELSDGYADGGEGEGGAEPG